MKRKFRQLIENNKWFKKVPNSLTICNSLCGFFAIVNTLNVYNGTIAPEKVLALSAWIILFAMVFDALDGFAARIFNAASMHGIQMDSLADMVTFGVAPAVLVAVMAHSTNAQLTQNQYFYILALCGMYLGCAALRLATYNVHAILEKKSGDKFTGLPSPGAAAAICSFVIFYSTQNGVCVQIIAILPFYAATLGALMVSNVPYTHIGKWLLSVRRNKKRLLMLCIMLLAIYLHPELATLVIINGYIASGPLIAILKYLGVIQKEPFASKKPVILSSNK